MDKLDYTRLSNYSNSGMFGAKGRRNKSHCSSGEVMLKKDAPKCYSWFLRRRLQFAPKPHLMQMRNTFLVVSKHRLASISLPNTCFTGLKCIETKEKRNCFVSAVLFVKKIGAGRLLKNRCR